MGLSAFGVQKSFNNDAEISQLTLENVEALAGGEAVEFCIRGKEKCCDFHKSAQRFESGEDIWGDCGGVYKVEINDL